MVKDPERWKKLKSFKPENFTAEERDDFFAYVLTTMKSPEDYGPPFEAPWIVFPHIPSPFSIGWRMGGGEDFMCAFQAWYKTASKNEREAYKSQWPEPETYEGFYDRLDGWHPVLTE